MPSRPQVGGKEGGQEEKGAFSRILISVRVIGMII